MKLIANNLRGKLSDGQPYKVLPVDTGQSIIVEVYTKSYEGWELETSATAHFGYGVYPDRRDAFIQCFKEVEQGYDIQLLRLEATA